jgi:hypothetical protein
MCEPDAVETKRKSGKRMIVLAGVLVALGAGTAFLAWLFGINSPEDFRACVAMVRGGFHPVWKDFVFHRIRPGDSVETLAGRRPPGKREDFGPYTRLYYSGRDLSYIVQVIGKDGVLVDARAGDPAAPYVFFGAPGEKEAFDQVYLQYEQQRELEGKAWSIHRVMAAGQDVFASRHVERSEVPEDPNEPGYNPGILRQMQEIYGADYLRKFGIGPESAVELTVEVNEVFHGGLQPGTVLKFRADYCEAVGPDGAETIFLHVDDARLLFPDSEGGEAYTTVPRAALEWYRSLTPEQVQEFEARWSSRGQTQEGELRSGAR